MVTCVSQPPALNLFLPVLTLNLCLPVLCFAFKIVIVTVSTYINSASAYIYLLLKYVGNKLIAIVKKHFQENILHS